MLYFLLLMMVVVVINVEAVTNIISKSELFKPLRGGLFNLYNSRGIKFAGFIHNIVDCPYCTSVWVSVFYVLCVYLSANSSMFLSVFICFCLIIMIHRFSNIMHHIIDRINGNSI